MQASRIMVGGAGYSCRRDHELVTRRRRIFIEEEATVVLSGFQGGPLTKMIK